MIKDMNNSVSIIIPALNEAGNVENAVSNITQALEKRNITDFEILIIDDGSTDETYQIVNDLCMKNNHISIFHNRAPKGLGYNFRMGVNAASKDYVGWFPGDNQITSESMDNIFEQIGKTDIIIPYVDNPRQRQVYRLILSHIYTAIFNIIFGLRLKYFNGPCFFKRNLLKTVSMTTDSPAYMAEIIVQLLKRTAVSYIEVPFYNQKRGYGKSSVLKWKNVYLIGKTVINLIGIIYFQSSQTTKI